MNWRDKLPPAFAENLFHYNLAQWHYAQKEHDKAQKALALIASTGQAERVKPIEERLRLYEHRRPFREGG